MGVDNALLSRHAHQSLAQCLNTVVKLFNGSVECLALTDHDRSPKLNDHGSISSRVLKPTNPPSLNRRNLRFTPSLM